MPGRAGWKEGGRLPAETRAYVGGITKTLKSATCAKAAWNWSSSPAPTAPALKIDPAQVTAVRAAAAGRIWRRRQGGADPPQHKQQAVRENVTIALSAIRATGG